MVNTVNNQIPFDPKAVRNNPTRVDRDQGPKKSADTKVAMDTVTLTQSTKTAETYTSSISPEDLADKSYEMLRKLVTNMLKEQGIDYTIATDSSTIDISEISQEEAQALIADDGYYGVEQTSDRIVDFAIAAAGGDVSKLDAIKEGVEKGFNEALEIFGGSLPDISYNTYDAVMEKLDTWASEVGGE